MNWVEIILVLHIVHLNLFWAIEFCPAAQYLNASGVCVDCTPCHGPKNFTIQPCSDHADSVCGTVADLKTAGLAKPIKSKKAKVDSVKLNSSKAIGKIAAKNPINSKQENCAKYDYELSTDKPTKKAAKAKKNKSKKIQSPVVYNDPVELAIAKLKASKNSKHIKKDLSQEGGSAAIEYAVKPKVVDVPQNLMVPAKAKTKSKDSNEPSIIGTQFVISGNEADAAAIRDNQWFHLVHPHVENHQIYVDVESESESKDDEDSSVAAKKGKKAAKRIPSQGDLTKALTTKTRPANKTDLIDLNDDEYNERVNQQGADESDENDVDEDEENDEDDDDDDDDDEDDEDDDDDEDEDEDEDTDEDEDYSLGGVKIKDKYPRFGVDSERAKIEEFEKFDEDDEYDVNDDLAKSVIYASANSRGDVNMEPFSSAGNWQLLILVSAVSACLLFFVVVNAYVCIYMKKWKHMKQDFEADVEDLSVRINLMQHAGFEADETSNMKNYITQLKGGKAISEKLPKTSSQA